MLAGSGQAFRLIHDRPVRDVSLRSGIGTVAPRSLRVLYVQYTNPAGYPPLAHSARLLADSGFKVLLLGTRRPDDPMEMPHHDRIQVALRPFQPRGWGQKGHYVRFLFWTIWRAVRWRPHWVYASDPLSAPIALSLMHLLRVNVIYHEHDLPALDRQPSIFMRVVMHARNRLAQCAALCVLPNEERAEIFRGTTRAREVVTVWNCPIRQEANLPRGAESVEQLRLLYHGSIVPDRLPTDVFEALAKTPSAVTLDVIGYETQGYPDYVMTLTNVAKRLDVADRVTFHGAVSRAHLMRLCASYDIGLSLLPVNPSDVNQRAMVGASNKPFDYMACGLALLVPDAPGWRAAYVEPGFGLACNPHSSEGIAAAMRWFLEHPEERVAMGQRGRDRIRRQWNYERMFAPVLARMQT